MNQTQVKFCITDDGEGINIEIEGTKIDLISVLATVINENEDVENMVDIALALVKTRREAKEKSDEDIIAMMSKIKPIAQA